MADAKNGSSDTKAETTTATPAANNQTYRIVVLGAGLVGAMLIARLFKLREQLAKHKPHPIQLSLTVIDKRAFYENNIGSVRSLVQTAFWKSTVKAHADWITKVNGEFVVGQVQDITAETVTVHTADGEKRIPYDYLVMATGSSYPLFKSDSTTLQEREQEMKSFSDRVKESTSVLIVGGGPTGIEIAGEIAHLYGTQKKQITLIDRNDRLNVRGTPKASRLALTKLQQIGVRVILNDSLDDIKQPQQPLQQQPAAQQPSASDAAAANNNNNNNKDAKAAVVAAVDEHKAPVSVEYKTKAGATIKADMIISAVGTKVNTDYLRAHMADLLDEHARVKVHPTLQVQRADLAHVFAIGDIASLPEEPLAANGKNHVTVVIHNLTQLITTAAAAAAKHNNNNKKPAAAAAPLLKQYKAGYKASGAVCIGPKYLIISLPFGTTSTTMMAGLKTSFMTKLPPDGF